MRQTFRVLAGTAAFVFAMTANAQAAPSNQAATQQPTAAAAGAGDVKAVTAADVKTGATVNDTKGNPVGKIESVSADAAVVSTGTARAEIPLTSFARNEQGLVIAMTKAELEAAAKKKSPKS
jgi:hypothetical protein